MLKQLCSDLLNLAVITNQSFEDKWGLNDSHAELLHYCGCGGYDLTQVKNEQVVSVYGLLNVDGCILGWVGGGARDPEMGAQGGWVRRQTQFGVVGSQSIDHLLLYLSG